MLLALLLRCVVLPHLVVVVVHILKRVVPLLVSRKHVRLHRHVLVQRICVVVHEVVPVVVV